MALTVGESVAEQTQYPLIKGLAWSFGGAEGGGRWAHGLASMHLDATRQEEWEVGLGGPVWSEGKSWVY